MSTTFYVELDLLSDTCLGADSFGGAGNIDTSTELDRNGFPILRGRSLKGLLVEQAAFILEALEPDGGPLTRSADRLFGAPRRFGSRADAYFHDGSVAPALRRTALRHGWEPSLVERALTVVRRQTKVGESFVAESGTLRSTRLIRAGIKLRARVDVAGTTSSADRGLLAASVAGLRRVGLHRNEGWGQVRSRILDEQANDVTTDWLRELENAADLPELNESITQPLEAASTRGRVVEVELFLQRPAVFSDQPGNPWATRTLRYVPGSAILGAVAERWLRTHPGADAATDDEFVRLFLDARCRWLNAYPLLDGKRAVPVPISLRRPKGEDAPKQLHDRAAEDGWGIELEGALKSQAVDGFAVFGEDAMAYGKTACAERMHHQRDREAGRSVNGEIFVNESIDAGQTFLGYVLCDAPEDAGLICSLLGAGPLQLGKSRAAGYGGQAKLEVRVAHDRPVQRVDNEGRAVLTLTSDYLGTNDFGLAAPGAFLTELGQLLLGRTLDPSETQLFLGSRPVGGQVGVWRMPRPTWPALAAGSVVVLRGAGATALSPDLIEKLEWEGLGARRAEGFGTIAVDLHGDKARLGANQLTFAVGSTHDVEFPSDAPTLAEMQSTMVRLVVRRALTDRAAAQARGMRTAPTSLIARLRDAARNASSLASFVAFIRALEGKKAHATLSRARLGGIRFPKWVEEQVPSYRAWVEVARAIDTASGLTLEMLPPSEDWRLQQHYLDTLFEHWRRASKDSGREVRT